MKRSVVFSLLAVLAISGCQVKEEGEFAFEGKPFTATMEAIVDDATDVNTKTSLDASGNVRWKRGDEVSIFAGSTVNEHYQITDASDGKTAAALSQVEITGFVAGGEISNNVAFYPYAATAEIAKDDGNSYVISDIALPAIQTYAKSSFGNGAFPMVAVTSSPRDYNLKFKNVLGGLKLQLKGTAAITSISIKGNNNDKLCGAAELTVSVAAAPAITLTDALAKTVTLDCGGGVQLNVNTATAFIIALPPMVFSGGFTVTVTDTENQRMEIKTTKRQTIARSSLLSMPAVTFTPSPVSEDPQPQQYDISFEKTRYGVDAGSSVQIHYSLPQESTLSVTTKDGWSATVRPNDAKSGYIEVTCPDPAVHSELKVTATTSDGQSVTRALPIMIRDPYTANTRTDVAALAYYCFNSELATDYNFQKLAEAGFNILTIEEWDNWQEQLTLAHKYGLKGILFITGPASDYYRSGGTSTELAEVVNEAKNYPALAGYQIFDEPSTKNIGQIMYEKAAIESLDPNPEHPIYIPLSPSSASSYTLGVNTYDSYVEAFANDCNLDFINFDQYPVFTDGIDQSWSTSLNVIRNISREHGIPFWAFTLCCREWQREDPTLGNIRLQCNTNLAYGAQVNQFFVYRSHSGTDFAPLQTWEYDANGNKVGVVKYTAAYDFCKAYNTEMHNRGYVFSNSDVWKICHTDDESYGPILSSTDLPEQISAFSTSRPALVSFIENNGNEYLVVCNHSWTEKSTIEMQLSDMVYVIDRNGVFTEYNAGGQLSLSIDAGDMLVIKYE